MVNSKEIALKALNRTKTEPVPVGIFLGGVWPILHSGLTLEKLIGDYEKTAQIYFEVNQKLGADIIITGAGATAMMIRALGGEVRFDEKGAPQIISPLITKEDDLSDLDYSLIIKNSGIIWLAESARKLTQLCGESYLVLASGRAPFTLATQICGLEKFSRAMYKKNKFAHKILEFTTNLSIAYFETMIEKGLVQGAFIADPTASGDVISKRHFEEFVLPYLKRVILAVKRFDKPIMLHICGNISDRLKLIPETGVDCLSIDTKVDIEKAINEIGDQVCIAGNVDPVKILEFGGGHEVVEATRECLRKGTGKGGFILMPGCDPAGGVSEENIKTFVDTAHNWDV